MTNDSRPEAASTATATSAPTLRGLLEDVAAGRLEPDLAAAVLAGGGAAAGADPRAGAAAGRPRVQSTRPQRLEILVDALDLRVMADPTVARLHVEGDLDVVERSDGVIELRLPTRAPSGDAYRFGTVGGLMAAWLSNRPARAVVRIHPEVPVSIATTASKVEVTGMVGGLNLRASASSVKLHRVAGPIALDLQSSSAKGSATLTVGASTIRGSMSSLELALLAGSDVAVATEVDLGSAKIAGELSSRPGTAERSHAVVGTGAASLDVRMTLSSAKVALP